MHLPLDMRLFIEVQQAWMRAYPTLGAMPADDVMHMDGTTVTFFAPEAS
jgi:hypothetical protein